MIDGAGYEWTDHKGEYTKMQYLYGNYVDGKTGNEYVRITKLDDPSENCLLKEIQYNKGTFSPEVNYDTTEYTIEVGPEDTDITIYGVVDDIKATVEGDGAHSLVMGENTIEITVTSEDGSSTNTYIYHIGRDREGNCLLRSLDVTNVPEEDNIEFD